MAQGKLKVKARLPANAKQRSVHRGAHRVSKAPKPPKMSSAQQVLQKEVTKCIRMSIEDNCRQKAQNDGKQLATKSEANPKTVT